MRLRREGDRPSQRQQHAAGHDDMYAEARRYVVTRYVISGIVSSLISLPLVVTGILIIIDVWNSGSAALAQLVLSFH